MDSAERPNAEPFLKHQEQHTRRARCGEAVSWGHRESIEWTVETLLTFDTESVDAYETVHSIRIPDDPEILAAIMHRLRERLLEQCGGSA